MGDFCGFPKGSPWPGSNARGQGFARTQNPLVPEYHLSLGSLHWFLRPAQLLVAQLGFLSGFRSVLGFVRTTVLPFLISSWVFSFLALASRTHGFSWLQVRALPKYQQYLSSLSPGIIYFSAPDCGHWPLNPRISHWLLIPVLSMAKLSLTKANQHLWVLGGI